MAAMLKLQFHDILPQVEQYSGVHWLKFEHGVFAVTAFLDVDQLRQLAQDIIVRYGPLPIAEPRVDVEARGQTADEKVELSVPPAEDEFLGEAEPPQEDRVTAVNPIRVEREDNSPEVPDHD